MENKLLNQLLFNDESNSLDFKRDQYLFNGQTNDVKSELLKDILAFTNSWRRETAYILIGVNEAVGGKNEIVGITSHLEDSNLQEFVNSKTNKPIDFSYQTFNVNEKSLGIIEIPVQARPIYLIKDYGKLKKESVYLRRGSSTSTATPSEMAEMGLFKANEEMTPNVYINIGNATDEYLFERNQVLNNTILSLPPENELNTQSKHPLHLDDFTVNHDYFLEYAEYLRVNALLNEVSFKIINISPVAIKNAQIKFSIQKQNNHLLVYNEMPVKPTRSKFYVSHLNQSYNPQSIIEQKRDRWRLIIDTGDIQPKEEIWSYPFYIGSTKNCSIAFNIKMFADNLPNPIVADFELSIKLKRGVYSRNEVIQMANNA